MHCPYPKKIKAIMIEIQKDLASTFLSQLKLKINLQQLPSLVQTKTTLEQNLISEIKNSIAQWIQSYTALSAQKIASPAETLLQLANSNQLADYPLISNICCELIIDSYQDQSECLSNAYVFLAEQLESLGHHLLAVQQYQKMISNRLDEHIAYNRIGLIFLSLQEFKQATIYFERCLQIKPDYIQALINMGVALQKTGDYEGAKVCFKSVIAKDPTQINAHYNLGISCFCAEQFQECIQSLQNALALNPRFLDAHYNLGVAYNHIKEHHLALEQYKAVIELDENYLMAHYNSGVSYFELLEYSHALDCYQKAISIDPEHIRSHWNLSHCKLVLGDLKSGFLEYEWRWRHNELQNKQIQRTFKKPLWNGESTIDGKRILLHAEQGFGDTLQFLRYVLEVKKLRAQVIVEVQPALKLLAAMTFLDTTTADKSEAELLVLARGEELPHYDLHCPLMSLPLALGIDDLPSLSNTTFPYLKVDTELREIWAEKLNFLIEDRQLKGSSHCSSQILQSKRRPRIGLIWSSGYREDQKETWEINKERNLHLNEIEPLLQLPIDWVSLQVGVIPNQELAALNQNGWGGHGLLDLSAEINNFADTAAIAQNLDLIISVDTSTAHLCGALGLETWVLLKANACWRWFLNTHQSPWYPSVRLFRQTQRGDWSGVTDQLHLELTAFLNSV